MPHYEMPSIKKELEKLEGEDPQVTLSRLKEEKRTLEESAEVDAWPPKERVRAAELTKQIEELEEKLRYPYKKAA